MLKNLNDHPLNIQGISLWHRSLYRNYANQRTDDWKRMPAYDVVTSLNQMVQSNQTRRIKLSRHFPNRSKQHIIDGLATFNVKNKSLRILLFDYHENPNAQASFNRILKVKGLIPHQRYCAYAKQLIDNSYHTGNNWLSLGRIACKNSNAKGTLQINLTQRHNQVQKINLIPNNAN